MGWNTDTAVFPHRTSFLLTRALRTALVSAAIAWPLSAGAGPWAQPGDEELRHHLTVLADAKILAAPITTWPIPWGSIKRSLDNADSKAVSESVLWSLQYVRFAFNRQTRSSARGGMRLQGGDSRQALRSFGDDRREVSEATAYVDWMGDSVAINLAGSVVDDAIDNKTYRPDGTYLAVIGGNWILSAGWQERWWGAGWQSSLILSNNARPVPALALQRNFADAFKTPLLSWLGPWQFTAFAGQLDSSAYVADAKLLGARFAFKPFTSLEIALSRTAQWGGEGRPESGSSLWDLVTGKDNAGSEGIIADNEPGNQLAGVDARWSLPIASTLNAVYVQAVGEDESNALPSRTMVLAGVETAFMAMQMSHRLILEFIDTEADRSNYAYEHGIYKDGYRYLGRPLGAAFDNDTRAAVMRGEHFGEAGRQLSWSIARIELNRDRSDRAAPGGSVFGVGTNELTLTTLSYGVPFADFWKITIGAEFYSNSLAFNDDTVDGGLFAKLELLW